MWVVFVEFEAIRLRAGDIGLDPFYKLVFPTMDMLTQEHQDLLNNACDAGDPKAIKATVEVIREALNPHPAGQKTLNAPKSGTHGRAAQYAETVLFFLRRRRRRATRTARTVSDGRSSSGTRISRRRTRKPRGR